MIAFSLELGDGPVHVNIAVNNGVVIYLVNNEVVTQADFTAMMSAVQVMLLAETVFGGEDSDEADPPDDGAAPFGG